MKNKILPTIVAIFPLFTLFALSCPGSNPVVVKKVVTTVNDILEIDNKVIVNNIVNIRETVKKIIDIDLVGVDINNVTYEAGNPFLASIDAQGNLTPLGTGVVEIKVLRKDNKQVVKSFFVRVEAKDSGAFLRPPTIVLRPLDELTLVGVKFNTNLEKQGEGNFKAKTSGNGYIDVFDENGVKLYSLPVQVKDESEYKKVIDEIKPTPVPVPIETPIQGGPLVSPVPVPVESATPSPAQPTFAPLPLPNPAPVPIPLPQPSPGNINLINVNLGDKVSLPYRKIYFSTQNMIINPETNLPVVANSNIYSMNFISGMGIYDYPVNITNNTDPSTLYNSLSVSKDGKKISYIKSKDLFIGGLSYFTGDIYTINSDGTNPTILFDSGGNIQSFSYSPDGANVVYSLYSSSPGHSFDIFIRDLKTNTVTKITSNPYEGITNDKVAFYSAPQWSPDGTKIAYERRDFIKYSNGSYRMVPSKLNLYDVNKKVSVDYDGIFGSQWEFFSNKLMYPCFNPTSPINISKFKFSPDGKQMLYSDHPGNLKILKDYTSCDFSDSALIISQTPGSYSIYDFAW